jgi:ribosomal protein S12 methylthiotransferase accessory factor
VSHEDIREELAALCRGLDGLGFTLFSVDTSEPSLALAANYNFVPGFAFRERDRHASLGLFVGRILAEESGLHEAELGLGVLERIYGTETHFLPFFRGMLALRGEEPQRAVRLFEAAEALQPDDENRALAAFYAAYARTLDQDWAGALPGLDRAVALSPEVKEYFNLRGVARFKLEQYQEAASDFSEALNLDRGSAMDLANLGVCHKFMGHKGEALDYLNSALELDPGLDFARTHRDELLAQ